jgi:four helix bundle protein
LIYPRSSVFIPVPTAFNLGWILSITPSGNWDARTVRRAHLKSLVEPIGLVAADVSGLSEVSMAHEPFEKLAVWQRSIELVETVYQLTREFPADEKSGLAATLRRTVTGIPAKIADGDGQDDPAKARQAFASARGTIRELQTYAVICRRMRFLGHFNYASLRRRMRKIDRMLEGQVELLEPAVPEEKPEYKPVGKSNAPPPRSLAA